VGACIRCFPKVYNRWWREQLFEQNTLHATLDSWAEGEDPLHAVPDHRAVDPCHAAVVSDQVERAFGATSDRALKEGIVLRSTGLSQSEAAEAVGLTEKALERRVGRWRQKLNREEGTR
jgi:DNA-directed RNA polymerase specialized sigma24 family protein